MGFSENDRTGALLERGLAKFAEEPGRKERRMAGSAQENGYQNLPRLLDVTLHEPSDRFLCDQRMIDRMQQDTARVRGERCEGDPETGQWTHFRPAIDEQRLFRNGLLIDHCLPVGTQDDSQR